MLKAVLRQGAIVPLDPVPSDWEDGTVLDIARHEDGVIDIDAWAKVMNELCADSRSDDEEQMQAAIDEHRRTAKDRVRRDMGLSA